MIIQSSTQLKDLIRNMARKKQGEPLVLMRNYMMERFLERITLSPYRDNFILKGGMLIAAMVGLDTRSTMDMDATIQGLPVTTATIEKMVEEILATQLPDAVKFSIKDIAEIMDDADYKGVRVSLEAGFDGLRIPLKIDFSTGDAITPREILFSIPFMLEKRNIQVMTYPLATILAEKLETVIVRSTANTRMRDLYDIYILLKTHKEGLLQDTLAQALAATAKRRNSSNALAKAADIIREVEASKEQQLLWDAYRKKFYYAAQIPWVDVMEAVKSLARMAGIY